MRILFLIFFLFFQNPLISKDYSYEIGIVLMFQNEARFLKEWIEYHKEVGVEHFYLYNNLSRDDFYPIIEPYIESGEAEYFDYPIQTFAQQDYHALQCEIYNHALSLAKGKVKWLAFIDADEYIVPLKRSKLNQELAHFPDSIGGVYLSWRNFGTSHVDKIPQDRLRIEMLLLCEPHPNGAQLGKSIVRPERVLQICDPHVFFYNPPYCHVTTDYRNFEWCAPYSSRRMQIYHYYTGDLDHLIHVKYPRRVKWNGIELESYIEQLEGLNSCYNSYMLKFVPQVRKALGLSMCRQ